MTTDGDRPNGSTSRPLAIVGTDTGVGKTAITAGLTRYYRERGKAARAIKPAQTGCPPDDDAAFVADACGDPDAAVRLRALEPPLAPRVAAERVGDRLSYDAILADCERQVDRAELALVEGIGGLRVPLAGDREVIDLVADLEATAVVVARSGLGTLNHTALSVAALERRGVDVRGIVCNEFDGATVAKRTNPAELERMTGRPVETVPSVDADGSPRTLATGVVDALSPSFLERLSDVDAKSIE
ncbi:dethiobiotin synthase [Natrarchaeobius oligotrophus]|uniref:ATP-dependent dethiobiotin synthetase BioD n=1 Tax=Natrarchaeobius chitinivorans TaxID=1679083 RepID=A0A3N6M4C5_NATCH|nr:dethiobiotin synthase [Natrarchaeobius chitinivorans]RQG96847.1 dethiobiotin synthase [Natrarchaeobius chitinivorans]